MTGVKPNVAGSWGDSAMQDRMVPAREYDKVHSAYDPWVRMLFESETPGSRDPEEGN